MLCKNKEQPKKRTKRSRIKQRIQAQRQRFKPRRGFAMTSRLASRHVGEETAIIEEFVTAKILKKQSLNLGEAESIREEICKVYKERGLISQKHNNIFTDKSLNNFFFLNLLKSIFPNAKITYRISTVQRARHFQTCIYLFC